MIRHIFVGNFKPDTTEADVVELLRSWAGLLDVVPGLRNLTAGQNVSPREHKYDVALVADLDDMDAWEAYMVHPEHVAIGQRISGKIIIPESRATVQIEIPDTGA
jgi:Stress responsive A/B Barrel Domain